MLSSVETYESLDASGLRQFSWLAEWFDYVLTLMRSRSNLFIRLSEYPVLGASYLYWVGRAALISESLMASYVPLNSYHYFALYMEILNVLFEIITVILTMRLISHYFGTIYASNVMFILIISPLVLWVTISRWDMLPLALTASILYFAVEKKPWYAWISLTIATLVKFYPIIFGIPLLFYYFKQDGFKKTLVYVLSMIALGVLIYTPFLLFYGLDIIFFMNEFQTRRPFEAYSTWFWIFHLFGNEGLLRPIYAYVQVGIMFTYVLLDYSYERKKVNPLSVDKALIKRFSITILLFLLTFKLGGYQYFILAFPLTLIFINCFRKLAYFAFWIITLHIVTYLTIIGYAGLIRFVNATYFLIWMTFFILYTVAIVLIHFNNAPYKNTITILNERDFMLELYIFVKKISKLFL
jgi:uncharacterized membrane protein